MWNHHVISENLVLIYFLFLFIYLFIFLFIGWQQFALAQKQHLGSRNSYCSGGGGLAEGAAMGILNGWPGGAKGATVYRGCVVRSSSNSSCRLFVQNPTSCVWAKGAAAGPASPPRPLPVLPCTHHGTISSLCCCCQNSVWDSFFFYYYYLFYNVCLF